MSEIYRFAVHIDTIYMKISAKINLTLSVTYAVLSRQKMLKIYLD